MYIIHNTQSVYSGLTPAIGVLFPQFLNFYKFGGQQTDASLASATSHIYLKCGRSVAAVGWGRVYWLSRFVAWIFANRPYSDCGGALPDRSSEMSLDGVLEITQSLETHERSTRLIERFIKIIVVEMGRKIKTMGSTRLNIKQKLELNLNCA